MTFCKVWVEPDGLSVFPRRSSMFAFRVQCDSKVVVRDGVG